MTGVAVDVGGTKIAAARCDRDGGVAGPVASAVTPAQDGADAVLDAVTRLVESVRSTDAAFLAVSSGGVIDVDTGVVVSAVGGIPGWAGTDLRGQLAARTGLPTAVVNDGHAFALGEHGYGAARGAASLLLVAAGTGIGGSYVDAGRAQFGANGFAGHFGHVPVPEAAGVRCPCGVDGHAEAVGGGAGIVGTYRRDVPDTDVTSVQQLVARSDHDPAARAAVELGGRAVGTLIGGLVNALDPAVVVVTGGVASAGTLWWSAVQDAAAAAVLPTGPATPVTLSASGPEMALRGATRFTVERLAA